MKSSDVWLLGFALRCTVLLVVELACFLFVIPTLFNLHSDLADLGGALVALSAIGIGVVTATALSRDLKALSGDTHDYD